MDFIMWTVVIILAALGAGISVFENIMKDKREKRVRMAMDWRVTLLVIFLLSIAAGIIYLGYSWWWLLLPAISMTAVMAMSMAAMSGDESRIMRDEAAKRSQLSEYSLSINGEQIDVQGISLDSAFRLGAKHMSSGDITSISGSRMLQGVTVELQLDWMSLDVDLLRKVIREAGQE